jgi:signal transduction histidine kinase
MKQSAAPISVPQTEQGVRIRGIWLSLGRAAWVMAALLALCLLVAGAPARIQSLEIVPPEAARIGQQLHAWEATLYRESGLGVQFYALFTTALDILASLVWLIMAAALFYRRSSERVALFAALALVLFGITMNGFPDALAREYPAWGPFLRGLNAIGMLFLTIFFYIFPDGRIIPGWTRWVLLVAVPVYALLYLSPGQALDPHVSTAGALVLVALTGLGVGAQVYRYRRVAGSVERQQIKWVIAGMGALVGSLIVVIVESLLTATVARSSPALYVLLYVAGYSVFTACKLAIPVALAVAILRYRLWDIDLIINRALVYGSLSGSVIGLYALIVGGLGELLQARGSVALSFLATGVVAIIFQPLHERLQRGVNRIMFGERDDPYAVVSRLGQRLESTLSPDAILPAVVQTVAQTLKLPYVAVTLREGDSFVVAARVGTPVNDAEVLPLLHQGETVGRLVLGLRPGEASFSHSDRRLLNDLARQAGIAAYAVRLTADLQRSRERLVSAREEERRRLRRDLHDGMGPALASMALQSEATRDLVTGDPEQAIALLSDLTDQLQTATADIRRLVHDLRPPALDDLGLIGALRTQTGRFEQGRLRITLDAPDSLPTLPAAVEVAAYRIILEAVNNVARHAGATACRIRLSLDAVAGQLDLEIADDGRGFSHTRQAGVGLASMRERAAELGGACVIETSDTGGTRIHATLPIPHAGHLSSSLEPEPTAL